MRKVAGLLCTAIVGWASLLCSTVRADTIEYDFSLDTTTLVGNPNLSVDFALYGYQGNSATVSSFKFGSGSATGSPIIYDGNASGDLGSSIVIGPTTLTNDGTNEIGQTFTAGDTLSFHVSSSEILATNDQPDAFVFSIYDGNNKIPTAGIYSELFSITYNNGGPTFSAYNLPASAAPLPASLAMGLVLMSMLALVIYRRRPNRNS